MNNFDAMPLITRIARNKLRFLMGILAPTLLAIIFLNFVTPRYRAESIVAPIGDEAELKGLSRLSGLARLAGASLGEMEIIPKFAMYRYLLHSPELSKSIGSENKVLPRIFIGQWDNAKQEWKKPEMLGRALNGIATMVFGAEAWREPDYRDLAIYLEKRLLISEVGSTGLVRLSYDHRDPKFGSALLGMLMEGADDLLRKQEKSRAIEEREYLLGQLRNVLMPEVKAALANLIASKEQELVSLSTSQPVSFKMVQPIEILPDTVYPPRLLIVFLAVSFGIIIGVADAARRKNHNIGA